MPRRPEVRGPRRPRRSLSDLRRRAGGTGVVGLGVALLVACAGTPAAAPGDDGRPTLAPGDHVFELAHDGITRRYLVHVPPSVPSRPALVLALHGGGGHAEQFADENGLDAVADREGFLAVHPDGTGPLAGRLYTWNAGSSCCGWAMDHEVDDVGFLEAVLDDLAERTAYDPARVIVTGHSNGAMMAYRFAVEAPERVAAAVPVGGAMALTNRRPGRPVPLLHIHSVDDPRALYEGGEGPPFPGTNRTVVHRPVEEGLAYWARENGCDPEPRVAESREGSGVDRGQTLTRLVWSGCDDGAALEHVRLTEVGHGWPGAAARPLLRSLLGRPTRLVDAAEAVWAFGARSAR